VTQNSHSSTRVNALILFLRFLAAHLLSLAGGLLLSLVTLPLWTGLLYLVTGKEQHGPLSWIWYLLTLAPFYVALSTLTILVLYPMWTGASDRSKSWRRIITVTVWVHVGFLLFINLIVGNRFIP
jgi:hypothetical protein